MNYHEEQEMELETIESIYWKEIEVLERQPFIKFSVLIQTEPAATNQQCKIIFEYVEKYPDELPKMNVEDANFDDKIAEELMETLKKTADESIGMVMVFQLVSAALEFLNNYADKIKLEEQENETKRKEAEEEAERKRFEGTRVTVDTFWTWRRQFEAEKDIEKLKNKDDKEGRKLTGKELFLQDKTLNVSDLRFLNEGKKHKKSNK